MGGIRNSGVWTDNATGLDMDVAAIGRPNIGTSTAPLGTVYATQFVGNQVGDVVLENNNYLDSTNAAGTGVDRLIKADASDRTVLNTDAATGLIAVNNSTAGTWSATAFTYPAYNLSDGSDKNYRVATYGAGTAYSLTNTAAAIDLGTTDPVAVINKAGTYLIFGWVNLQYVGATFAANRTVTIKLRRTNNTPADLTGGTVTLGTNVTTTVTGTLAIVSINPVVYTTANTDDSITLFGDVSTVPSAGSLDVTQASVVAVRLTA